MARRKKEQQSVHRKAIALVAQDLFLQKWIEHTSMDDIAKKIQVTAKLLCMFILKAKRS